MWFCSAGNPINTIISVKRLLYFFVFITAFLCCNIKAFAQSTSNQGTEFWTAWMMHSNGASGNGSSSMSLYITGDAATSGTVSSADGAFTYPYTITPNNITIVNIDASAYLNGQSQFLKGIHITSLKPVVVYAHIFASNRSGATLVLPVATLANDYYTINYTQRPSSTGVNGGGSVPVYSSLCVIAAEDDTEVEITPTAALQDGTAAGQVKTIHLAKKGELYQALAVSDLTGTRVRSVSTGTGCKKIAVYSGSTFIYIGLAGNSGDNLFQQNYPVNTWGKSFISAPLATRAYDVIRIVCSDPLANVTVNGTALNKSTLVRNFYYEFPAVSTAQVIKSDKPIQVAQYSVTQTNGNDVVGDPEMIYLSPIEQGLTHVTLYSPRKFNITQSYINVIIPTSAAATFILDGAIYPGTFTPIDATYSYAQILVGSDQTHVISASSAFNAIAYGFGNFESYGYAAGTNLSNLNEFIALNSTGTNPTTQLNGCSGVPYYLQLTVPYQPLKIIWDPGDGSQTETQPNPVHFSTTTAADGTTLYTYRYSHAITFAAGDYSATATVTLPVVTSTDCGAEKIIYYNFNIADPPDTKFEQPAAACPGSATAFVNTTDAKGAVIQTWNWNFGDPNATAADNTSILQNPTHTYTAPGNYPVTLTATNVNGCTTTSSTVVVHINKKPTARFAVAATTCPGSDIAFTDQSVPNEGVLNKWVWNFDDPTSATNTSNIKSPSHNYAQPGTYHVTLQVFTDKDCTDLFAMDVVVHPLPKASFTLPEACVVDFAKFINTSNIADNTESDFTYLWAFGDGQTSPFKDPQHKYAQPGNYTVTLTVTSKYHCTDFISLPFVLNAAIPKAEFEVTSTNICSSDELIMKDITLVDPGSVTKYEFYYDADGQPGVVETYGTGFLPIPADKIFRHKYDLFNAPASKNYRVRIFVYSGNAAQCSAVYDVGLVTVNANPVVTLPVIANVCQEDGVITITPNTSIYTGTSTFTGDGITMDGANGKFDAKKAGPGNHTIHYSFATNGTSCTFEKDFDIFVNPTPLITGKRDVTVDIGGQVQLDPVALSLNGAALTYQWAPAAGLNHSNIQSPVASPATDTQYLLTVTSANGCVAKGFFNVKVLQQPTVYNTFTPNSDLRNDTWIITNMDRYPMATVEVFNRNGSKVYYSVGYPVPWDGRYNGADLPVGAYYYIINLKNGKEPMSGSLTLIR